MLHKIHRTCMNHVTVAFRCRANSAAEPRAESVSGNDSDDEQLPSPIGCPAPADEVSLSGKGRARA
jgi:hypothetical protein